jgi:hypothetical protein
LHEEQKIDMEMKELEEQFEEFYIDDGNEKDNYHKTIIVSDIKNNNLFDLIKRKLLDYNNFCKPENFHETLLSYGQSSTIGKFSYIIHELCSEYRVTDKFQSALLQTLKRTFPDINNNLPVNNKQLQKYVIPSRRVLEFDVLATAVCLLMNLVIYCAVLFNLLS